LRFEWDPAKAAENLTKHGVSFEEAQPYFPRRVIGDWFRSGSLIRRRAIHTFGVSTAGHLLVVAHTERGDTIRIISARPVTPGERKIYRKASRKPADELRREYKRADFGTLVRGKYAQRVVEATNVVVLEPQVSKAFQMIAQ